MRRDSTQTSNFREADEWKFDMSSADVQITEDSSGNRKIDSLSGNERNHLFLNKQGKDFEDVSLVSGLDSLADGRAFVYLDFDRDGWQDIAVVNANAPLVNLYRNEMHKDDKTRANRFIALRFVGGNSSDSPNDTFSNRDGFGVKVRIAAGDFNLIREHRCGEGFCAQNTASMIIGIDTAEIIDELKLEWPSGISTVIENIESNQLLTCFEDVTATADGSGFVVQNYVQTMAPLDESGAKEKKLAIEYPTGTAGLKVFTSMATWCPNCKQHIPQFGRLASAFETGEVEFYGLPVDPEDGPRKLADYQTSNQPAYELMLNLTNKDRDSFLNALQERSLPPSLPSTIITDGDFRILKVFGGVPDVSMIKKFLSTP